ncbi:hypothetical protein JTB14_000283 [Gonioctena quinquepunctata]|nr:hypothetical protein JTB14_000283 [Gonioctena quinquepunctata]
MGNEEGRRKKKKKGPERELLRGQGQEPAREHNIYGRQESQEQRNGNIRTVCSRAQKILNLLKNYKKQEEKSFMNQDHSNFFFAETSSLKENYDTLNCEIIETSTECTDSLIDIKFQSSQVFIVQADGSLEQISNAVTSTDTINTVIAIDSLPPLDDNSNSIASDEISDSNVVPNETKNNGVIEENTSIIDSSVSRQANENERTINIDGDNIKVDEIVSPKRRKRHKVNERKWASKKAKILREKYEEYQRREPVDGKSTFSVVEPKREMKDVKLDHRKSHVSKRAFSETLGIGDWMALNWIKERKSDDIGDNEVSGDEEGDIRETRTNEEEHSKMLNQSEMN